MLYIAQNISSDIKREIQNINSLINLKEYKIQYIYTHIPKCVYKGFLASFNENSSTVRRRGATRRGSRVSGLHGELVQMNIQCVHVKEGLGRVIAGCGGDTSRTIHLDIERKSVGTVRVRECAPRPRDHVDFAPDLAYGKSDIPRH